MLSDIEIAQKNVMDEITGVAEKLNLSAGDLETYGNTRPRFLLKSSANFRTRH